MTVFRRRELKVPFENATQVQAVAKSGCRCHLLDPFGALFEPLPGCIQTCLLDILGGRGPRLAGEDPRKVARAHRNSISQFLHRQITG
jgi:hypothetical protein